MAKRKTETTIRRPSDKQLKFIWNTLTACSDIIGDIMAKGARGMSKNSNDVRIAKRIIQQQRLYNFKSKHLKQ